MSKIQLRSRAKQLNYVTMAILMRKIYYLDALAATCKRLAKKSVTIRAIGTFLVN